MVNQERMREAMCQARNVRNMAVIAHVDHGKTTLTDALLARAGVISLEQAGDKCATHTRKDEQAKGITIKSTAVSMLFERIGSTPGERPVEGEGRPLVVHLIDSPGHVDFSSEVTAALRIADGAMVVVDCIEGVCVQTETVLRQALAERIRPVLMVNKMDRAVFEIQLTPEEMYRALVRIVENVNVILATYGGEDGVMGDIMLDPAKGNVAFGSGLHGWGFNLDQFARMYADRFKVKAEKLRRRLWGDHFYSATDRKWRKTPAEGFTRGFNLFVVEPLVKMLRACKDSDMEKVLKLTSGVNVTLSTEERDLAGKGLMRCVMKKWLPAADAMLDMIGEHLPSPEVAQQYRTDMLYEGPLDDSAAVAMKKCDPNGPLMIFVSKMVPAADKGRFWAIGRVFSGTVATGMKVRIMGPDYKPGSQTDLFVRPIQGTKIMVGASNYSAGEVPCGNIVGLGGVDKYLLKTGTITTYEHAHNLRVLKFSVSPVVRVAVDVVNPAHLPKLVEGLKRLGKADPMVQCIMDGGQHVVMGAGELHLSVCLQDLEEEHAGVPIKKSEPVVTYQETVSAASDRICLAKTPNKLCRLYMTARPLPDGLPDMIEKGTVKATQDVKERGRLLVDQFDFNLGDTKKIWCFGPNGSGPNMLVDTSKAVNYLQDIRDSVVAGFQWATAEGVLSESTVRGVRFNIEDAMVHGDSSHRGGSQIIPATRRALYAAMLTAGPRILEPVYLVEVACPSQALGGAINLISRKRGEIIMQTQQEGTPMCVVMAYMPVNESFGFNEQLRGETGGQAFPQFHFDHWQTLAGDPLDATSRAGVVVAEIRQRKGLAEKIPALENYLDRI
ncbi:EF2-like protein [Mya arenaria]|uniref:EF2-like protein n=1 Tax=Mya arenaria TaxID=6604 RepID=A0ABY7EGL4_MYAAR|nr:elongation factor 2-like [Mya arenaria]WAR08245.1 EF2-like protein [Mya arenaria]